MKPTVSTAWRDDPVTLPQIEAMTNYSRALGWDTALPNTKGEASDLLAQMSREAATRIAISGTIVCDSNFDDAGDDDENYGDHLDDIYNIY
jgi:hypothetical protein